MGRRGRTGDELERFGHITTKVVRLLSNFGQHWSEDSRSNVLVVEKSEGPS